MSQNIKREIFVFGTKMEAKITGIDWGAEAHKRLTYRPDMQATQHGRMYAMIEDDMSFMEPIFMGKQLPFPEYLVKCGYHPMTQEVLNKQAQLIAAPHEEANPLSTHGGDEQIAKRNALEGMMGKYGLHFAAQYKIPCAGGAEFSVSVISGKMFYSRIDAPYEIMGVALEDGDDGDEPLPYQTDEQLMIYLAKVIAKAQEY